MDAILPLLPSNLKRRMVAELLTECTSGRQSSVRFVHRNFHATMRVQVCTGHIFSVMDFGKLTRHTGDKADSWLTALDEVAGYLPSAIPDVTL